jgi:hypothetical protein
MKTEQIVPYLAHDLKILVDGIVCEVEGIDLHFQNTLIAERVNYPFVDIKPLLHPLSSFKKFEDILEEMSSNDFLAMVDNPDTVLRLPYDVIQLFYKNKVDIHGLIANGHALDINTVKHGY